MRDNKTLKIITIILFIVTISVIAYGFNRQKALQKSLEQKAAAKPVQDQDQDSKEDKPKTNTYKIMIHSDQTLASESFSQTIAEGLKPDEITFIKSIYPGSQVSIALAEEADIILVPQTDENKDPWEKVDKKGGYYKDIKYALLSFGGIEAEAKVNPNSAYRAYDKLISQCIKKGQSVVFGNPPPKISNDQKTWDKKDPYISHYENFRKLNEKWGIGVDIWGMFKEKTESGENIPSDFVENGQVQTPTAAAVIAAAYINKIKTAPSPQSTTPTVAAVYPEPELKDEIWYYLYGAPKGSWTLEPNEDGFEERLLGYKPVANTSSKYGDTLTFKEVTAEQIHIIYRQDESYGTFQVIIDEGTSSAKYYTVNSGTGKDGAVGRIIADFLPFKPHTVKIKVTSSGKPVKIHGVVGI